MRSRDDQWYEIAAREVQEKNLVPSTWGRAFSQALGDGQIALALYIKFRVEQLEREFLADGPCREVPRPKDQDSTVKSYADMTLAIGLVSIVLGWTVVVPIVAIFLFWTTVDTAKQKKSPVPETAMFGLGFAVTFGFVECMLMLSTIVNP